MKRPGDTTVTFELASATRTFPFAVHGCNVAPGEIIAPSLGPLRRAEIRTATIGRDSFGVVGIDQGPMTVTLRTEKR